MVAIPSVIVGAYAGWILWHPVDSLMVWLVAVPVLIVAGVLALVPRQGTRRIALVLAVASVGVLAGVLLGPHRPALEAADGHIEINVETPMPGSGAHSATCQFDEAGTELQVSGDPNLRLDLFPANPALPADVDGRPFVGISITVGDRWRDDAHARTDNVDLSIWIGRVEEGSTETQLAASDASSVEIQWTPAGGSLAFANLVDVTDPAAPAADPLGLRGVVAWTCDTVGA